MHSLPKKKSCGFLLFRREPTLQFLLMKHPRRWDLPKGHLKDGETELEGAYREVEEETGITSDLIELDKGFRFENTYFPRYAKLGNSKVEKTLVIFLGWLNQAVSIQTTEHHDFKWFDWAPPHAIQRRTIDPMLRKAESHFISFPTEE